MITHEEMVDIVSQISYLDWVITVRKDGDRSCIR